MYGRVDNAKEGRDDGGRVVPYEGILNPVANRGVPNS